MHTDLATHISHWCCRAQIVGPPPRPHLKLGWHQTRRMNRGEPIGLQRGERAHHLDAQRRWRAQYRRCPDDSASFNVERRPPMHTIYSAPPQDRCRRPANILTRAASRPNCAGAGTVRRSESRGNLMVDKRWGCLSQNPWAPADGHTLLGHVAL
jgi:hypothetical protein